jgi:general stress protein 26
MFFKDATEMNYIILKGTAKLTGDKNTTKDVWWTKEGKECTENPYDYRKSPEYNQIIRLKPINGQLVHHLSAICRL